MEGLRGLQPTGRVTSLQMCAGSGVPTWEKISTRCPSSRSFLSIFCSSMSFPEDLTRELPS